MDVFTRNIFPFWTENGLLNLSKIVEAQTESGSWVINPLVSNQKIDWKIQLSYAI